MSTKANSLLLEEFYDQIAHPAVGDESWKQFFQALLILNRSNHPLLKIINQVREKRTGLTNRHLSHLVFKAFQFIEIKDQDFSYIAFTKPSEWQEEINKIFSHPDKVLILKKLLNFNSVSTTIYERYIGSYSILTEYFQNQPVVVGDFGCGGNYGLRGFDLGLNFKPFKDLSENERVKQAVNQHLHLKQGYAIDRENPEDSEVRAWRLACRFFPKELDGFDEVVSLEKELDLSNQVNFLKGTILGNNPFNLKLDAVISSLVFYQLTRDEQLQAINYLKNLLKPGGILIIQDYGNVDLENPGALDFNVSWHTRDFGFKTFVMGEITGYKFKEVLCWFDSRCTQVKPGRDFKIIFKSKS